MRFRVRNASAEKSVLIQMGLSMCWIVMATGNLLRAMRVHSRFDMAFDIVCLAVFMAALTLHLYFFFNGSITLDPDSFTIRLSFRPLTLPYSAVVDAQPTHTQAGTSSHVVELEIARVAPDVYPHQYQKLYLADPNAFLLAMRSHLQHPV